MDEQSQTAPGAKGEGVVAETSKEFVMDDVLKQLRGDEGVKYFIYDDATGLPIRAGTVVRGNPTVGVGRNLVGKGLSDAEVQILLSNDVNACAAELDNRIPWWRKLSARRQAQMINLDFNMGWGSLSGFKNFLAEMEAEEWEAAVAALKASHWWVQVGKRGPEIAGYILAG